MTAVPIAFQTNTGKYNFEGTAQLINAYAEQRGNDAKAPLSVLPCPGLVEFAEDGGTPCRGLIYLPDLDCIYAIHNTGAYKVTSDGTSTGIGIVPGTDTVQLSRNQNATPQTVVQTASGVLLIESDAVSYILDEDLPSDVISADYIGGYHAYGRPNREWFISALNDARDINALDFATFEQKAGKLIRVHGDRGELFGFCNDWTEVWRDTGNADFPFEPLETIQRGLLAKHGVVSLDNSLVFPGNDGIVYRLDGYTPKRVSTHSIERTIQADMSASDMIGFAWTKEGHSFANLTGSDWSRCFDAATGVWHSRESFGYPRWRARHAVSAWGKTIVGDSLSGKLFYLDDTAFTEDGETMVWGVDFPPMHAFPNGGIVDAVHFDLATGYGTVSGQGVDPKVMLWVSTDGGNEFTQYRELSLGARGQHAVRVTARRLGRFGPKGIVFRLRISDPVVRGLVAADVEVRPLKR